MGWSSFTKKFNTHASGTLGKSSDPVELTSAKGLSILPSTGTRLCFKDESLLILSIQIHRRFEMLASTPWP